MQPRLDRPAGRLAAALTTGGEAALAERSADELAGRASSLRHDLPRRDALPIETAASFHSFRSIAVEVVRADTPGPASSDLASPPLRRPARPIFPFDPIDDWRSAGP
jgi:microcystin degradation protein MlrC